MSILVAHEEVRPLIPVAVHGILDQAGVFDALEREAAKIVRDKTGIDLPAEPTSRLATMDWVLLPMSWLIAYLASNQVSNLSDESRQHFIGLYDEAVEALAARHASGSDGTTNRFGTIQDLW